ncbi:MAG: glucuronate isomerase [Chlorobi bacterium]|nr:glucuronate isomerase [Chlorobiota bacterium]
MKAFIDEDFLLENKTAGYLYHNHAVKMPVIDYHCHLDPGMIERNDRFENITQAWLHGDHYKWRAMRANGINEKYITGDAADREKFAKWAETVPYTLRNPLYHWTHLELRRYFGITALLQPSTADEIYESTSEDLNKDDYRTQGLLRMMNVEVVCTTDDPVDSLEHHRKMASGNPPFKMIPAWRPDKAMAVENPETWNQYINRLAETAGSDIKDYQTLIEALQKRHEFFHINGCRLSDHGLEKFYASGYTQHQVSKIFDTIRRGETPSFQETEIFKSALLFDLAVMDFESGWTQQFHVGALRNTNSRMFGILGPDTGYDSIGDPAGATETARFLNRLETSGKLGRTILYNLNPADNEVMATITGNFQDGTVPGKIQWGSAWWFLDQKNGIEKQLNTLSAMGLLSRFAGMLTDSRSFLSFPRHEYFRRILCNLIGRDVENGEIPGDKELLGKMVEDICYYNARNYFGFYQEEDKS